MIYKYILPVALTFALHLPTTAQATSIAVFPVEDLSRGRNSANFELTDYLSQSLERMGLEVVPKSAVISFMVRNRIRRLGFLNTKNIMEVKKELRADFILFVTASQNDDKKMPSIGLTFNLVRTGDAAAIWSNSGGISRTDMRHILGLSEPRSTTELLPVLANKIFAGWPEHLDGVNKLPPIIDIENVTLSPKHIRPGQEIICKVKLRAELWDNDSEGTPQVFIKIGNRLQMAMETNDGQYYEAAWTGSGTKDKNRVRLAMQSPDLHFYEGVWTEYDKDDSYPVNLILSWPSGKQKVAFLGTYYVDSLPPDVTLKLKGTEINGKTTFRDKLLIIPKRTSREPVSRWEISIEDQAGTTIISHEATGNIPNKLQWLGQNSSGKKAPDGPYLIIVKLWDRAENLSITSQPVELKHTPPNILLDAVQLNQNLQITINSNDTIPLSFWRVELRTDTGDILKLLEGETLPTEITASLPTKAEPVFTGSLECVVQIKDILGNKAKKNVKNLIAFAKSQKAERDGENGPQTPAPEAWVAEF